jgi:hypothetical protein
VTLRASGRGKVKEVKTVPRAGLPRTPGQDTLPAADGGRPMAFGIAALGGVWECIGVASRPTLQDAVRGVQVY